MNKTAAVKLCGFCAIILPTIAKGSPLTRTEVINTARTYVYGTSVTISVSNLINPSAPPNQCDIRYPHNGLGEFQLCAGSVFPSEAYKLGGYDSPYDYLEFMAAGSLIVFNSSTLAIVGKTYIASDFTGIDCSGLIASAWNLPSHEGISTQNLPAYVMPLNLNQMKPGDIFVYSVPPQIGHAAILVSTNVGGNFVSSNPNVNDVEIYQATRSSGQSQSRSSLASIKRASCTGNCARSWGTGRRKSRRRCCLDG
jgi:hypothetical protein